MHTAQPLGTPGPGEPPAHRPGIVDGLRRSWLSLSVGLLLVALGALMLSVVVRSDLWRFWGAPFTADQFRAMFAFLGAALGVVATLVAALLTKANNDRTLVQKEESEQRVLAQAREAQNRQRLDTAISVLGLIKTEDQYAGKAVTGAAITTLVVLGYPVIAMRTLQAALNEQAVDSASAAWVIDQVLGGRSILDGGQYSTAAGRVQLEAPPSREDAIGLLYDHYAVFTDDERPGKFEWPRCAAGQWPPGLDQQSGWTLMLAMLRLLTSRPASWWTADDLTWSWVIYTLYQVTEDPAGDQHLRAEAATYSLLLLDAFDGDTINGSVNEMIQARDLREKMTPLAHPAWFSNPQTERTLRRWISEARNPSGGSPLRP